MDLSLSVIEFGFRNLSLSLVNLGVSGHLKSITLYLSIFCDYFRTHRKSSNFKVLLEGLLSEFELDYTLVYDLFYFLLSFVYGLCGDRVFLNYLCVNRFYWMRLLQVLDRAHYLELSDYREFIASVSDYKVCYEF